MVGLSLPAAMAGTLTFYVGLYHLWLHFRRPRRADLLFSATCVAMAVYDLGAAMLYSAANPEQGAFWQRVQLCSLMALAMPLIMLIAEQGGLKLPKWALWMLTLFPGLALIGAVERWGWLLSDEAKVLDIRAFGHHFIVHGTHHGPMEKLLELSVPILTLFCLWVGLGAPIRAKSTWRRLAPRSSPLVLVSAALMLSVLHDIFVARGLLGHPFFLEYAWLFVMGTMNWSMADELMDASRTKVTLDETERRVATTLAAIQDAVITCDLAGNITHMNPAAEKLLAVKLWDVLDTPLQRYLEITSPETHAVVSDPVRFAVGRQPNPYGELPQLVTTDGNERRIDLGGAPLKDPEGQIQGAILVMRDLTLQHNALTNLEHAKRMESMGQLAGGAAHDLNNLLTPIISYVELVQRKLDADCREAAFLVHVQDAAQRAAVLTRQLLALSRKQVLDVQVIPLEEFIRQTAPMLERLVGDQIQVSLNLRDRGARVRVDPGQFEQVLLNLTSNARDAISGLEGRIAITTRRIGEHEVAIEVADNGSGMTPEVAQKIFEPFFTTKPRGKGTGLGLASVRGIIEQQNGKIYVDSEPNKGTSFEIVLPISVSEQPMSSAQHTPPSDLARGNESILVAEDDPAVRSLIYDALTQLGYTVHTADGMAVAVAIAKSEHVDLLLTDVVLPGTDGPRIRDEVLRYINVPCMFMTGHADDRLGERGIVERGTEVLRKPFTVTELGESVRRVLDRRHSARPISSKRTSSR